MDFISLIDYYLCHGYRFLIYGKPTAFEDFMIYKAEVEKQLEKNITIVIRP